MLDRAEAEHDLVILHASCTAGDDPWTEFCLQQADRILAVTSGGEVPEWLRSRPDLRGCDLVVHDVAAGSGRLAGFAEALDPIEAHSIRSETLDADIARLARRLTGRSVGLVLVRRRRTGVRAHRRDRGAPRRRELPSTGSRASVWAP